MSQLTRTVGRAFLGGVAAGGTIAAIGAIRRSKWAADLERINHKGDTVSLAEGPGITIGATAGAVLGANSPAYAAAAATSGAVAGAVGLYDDIADSKGRRRRASKATSAPCSRAACPPGSSRSSASPGPGSPPRRSSTSRTAS
nr:hypothetical protein GCM10025732_29380 [Glycomyces mayteni]